jgi:hypothetical protein
MSEPTAPTFIANRDIYYLAQGDVNIRSEREGMLKKPPLT